VLELVKSLVPLVCMSICLHKNAIVVALTLTRDRGVRFRSAAFARICALAACACATCGAYQLYWILLMEQYWTTPNASSAHQNPFQFSGDTVKTKDRRIFHSFNDFL
jgi:hypothetical protein